MGNLTIRNLDDGVIDRLKAQARANQRSRPVKVTVDASVAVKWFVAEDHRKVSGGTRTMNFPL